MTRTVRAVPVVAGMTHEEKAQVKACVVAVLAWAARLRRDTDQRADVEMSARG